jgi:hypothetical protein
MTDLQNAKNQTTVSQAKSLLELLEQNYLCLNRYYRAGQFETLVGVVGEWPNAEPGNSFYELSDDQDLLKTLSNAVSWEPFKKAIWNLWDLTKYVQRKAKRDVTNSILILRCRILIYEATDYFLKVPPELETDFINYAAGLPTDVHYLEPLAVRLNDDRPFENKDSRAKVIKVQLIAALCGVNAKYRKHNSLDAMSAEDILQRLTTFIENELPNLHDDPRPSFGLLALAWYLKGRILSSRDLFAESRKAFRRSADAYVARLRQKEEFLLDGKLKPEAYREKVSVTIRRTALVTAFGDGYLAFVNSRIADALESLTLARAALAQNSGRVYITYVDMLHYACLCAQHSSNPQTLDEVIKGLGRCRLTFNELVPNSHYFHRAGLRLAAALFYRALLSPDNKKSDYEKGLGYIDAAIDYAGEIRENKPRNPHLLSTAQIAKSRVLISEYQSLSETEPTGAIQCLIEAEVLANRADQFSAGFIEKKLEANTTLGEVYMCLAQANRSDPEKFKVYFDKALFALRAALEINRHENIRIEGVCFLQLSKLCLLNPNTEVLAYDYFQQWEKIKDNVEHEYCRVMARDLEAKLGVPFFLIRGSDSLNSEDRRKQLEEFLLDRAMKMFVAANLGRDPKDPKLRRLLEQHLEDVLGYSDSKVYKMLKEFDLMKKLQTLLAKPLEGMPSTE